MIVVGVAGAQPQAAAWIVREARERVPAVVSRAGGRAAARPAATPPGEVLPLEPPQVVGKHCAASGKVIAYEPDARVCPRCERVYHKATVPRGVRVRRRHAAEGSAAGGGRGSMSARARGKW